MEKIVILDNIRSAHNVGSVFRTADGAGVSRIILGGYTPAPKDRFGRTQVQIEKTSLGASLMVPYEQCVEEAAILARIASLQEEGFTVVAVEQTPEALDLYDFSVPEKVAYIFGNEVDGVREALCVASDSVVEIPMHGQKESLNVSVSAGIVLYHR